MTNITLVTGNKNKVNEWRRLLPEKIVLDNNDIDLDEIQSANLEEVVVDKVKRAYEAIGKPVIVEDIAAGIDALNGLPGPFIKFFVKEVGNDCLVRLAGKENEAATVSCAIAYYDGESLISTQATVRGVCVKPRGANGFGFDFGFIPNGAKKTFAEMTPNEKDAISHRSKAINQFLPLLHAHINALKKRHR